ncbi:MAG: hypothetical protein AAF441_06385, partial [Pseudomonadota bacterium]
CSAGLPGIAQADETEAWHLSEGNGKVTFYYGAKENNEILSIFFSCAIQTGTVEVWLPETSQSYKAGEAACVTLAAGDAVSTFCGATSPNELAGIPSLTATAPINASIFGHLEGSGLLSILVDGGGSSVPLKSAGVKGSKFAKSCRP